MIFFTWFIALTYTGALAVGIMNTFFMFNGYLEYWSSLFLSAPFEVAFLGLEIPVVVFMALCCMQERRAFVLGGEGYGAKWYHLPQYRS